MAKWNGQMAIVQELAIGVYIYIWWLMGLWVVEVTASAAISVALSLAILSLRVCSTCCLLGRQKIYSRHGHRYRYRYGYRYRYTDTDTDTHLWPYLAFNNSLFGGSVCYFRTISNVNSCSRRSLNLSVGRSRSSSS